MILLVCLALVLVSVPLAGGSLGALSRLEWRHRWMPASAVLLQILVVNVLDTWVSEGTGEAVHLASYGLAVAFLVVNRQIPWLWVVGLGGLGNLVAIAANGGVMPADPGALARAGLVVRAGEFANSTAVTNPRLAWLGDYFAVPARIPLANVFSVGDLVLVLGAALVLHRACGSRLSRHRTEVRAALAASALLDAPVDAAPVALAEVAAA